MSASVRSSEPSAFITQILLPCATAADAKSNVRTASKARLLDGVRRADCGDTVGPRIICMLTPLPPDGVQMRHGSPEFSRRLAPQQSKAAEGRSCARNGHWLNGDPSCLTPIYRFAIYRAAIYPMERYMARQLSGELLRGSLDLMILSS